MLFGVLLGCVSIIVRLVFVFEQNYLLLVSCQMVLLCMLVLQVVCVVIWLMLELVVCLVMNIVFWYSVLKLCDVSIGRQCMISVGLLKWCSVCVSELVMLIGQYSLNFVCMNRNVSVYLMSGGMVLVLWFSDVSFSFVYVMCLSVMYVGFLLICCMVLLCWL